MARDIAEAKKAASYERGVLDTETRLDEEVAGCAGITASRYG